MSKTNDIAKARRAHQDVIRQGLPVTHPTRMALQARLDRLDREDRSKRPLGHLSECILVDMLDSKYLIRRRAAVAELHARRLAA